VLLTFLLAYPFLEHNPVRAIDDITYFNFYLSGESPPFTTGPPTILGSGCPKGSVEIISSPDGQTITVLFSKYIAETDEVSDFVRKSCNVAIPVDVDEGKSIGLVQMDYRGYAYVDSDPENYVRFSAEYFFAGEDGPKTREIYQDSDEEFIISRNVSLSEMVWCPCGDSTIFRINTSIEAYQNDPGSDIVKIAIDTSDTNNGFEYFFAVRDC